MAKKGCPENRQNEQQNVFQIEAKKPLVRLEEIHPSGNAGDQQQMNHKTDHAGNFFPIGRDQRDYAETDSQSAQADQRPQTERAGSLRFIFPDTPRRVGVDQAGVQPNIQFPVRQSPIPAIAKKLRGSRYRKFDIHKWHRFAGSIAHLGGMNVDAVLQCSVNRTFFRNFQQLAALFLAQVTLQNDRAVDHVNPVILVIAAAAILDMVPAVFEHDMHGFERNALAIRVHFHRHRGAGPERCQQQIVGRGPAVGAAEGLRLIGKKDMFADTDGLLKLACAGFDRHQ